LKAEYRKKVELRAAGRTRVELRAEYRKKVELKAADAA